MSIDCALELAVEKVVVFGLGYGLAFLLKRKKYSWLIITCYLAVRAKHLSIIRNEALGFQ